MLALTTRNVALLGFAAFLSACASNSRFEGMDADQIYRMAEQDFADGDFEDAAEAFDRILIAFPSYAQIAEANFLLGQALYNSKQFITAASEFTRFLGSYPAHPRAPEAALGVCKSNEALSPHYQRDQTFTEQALLICQNVANDYLGTAMGTEAGEIAIAMRNKLAEKLFESGMYYFRRGAYDSSVINFEDVIEAYPGTVYAPRALVKIMDAYTVIGYADEVESARNRLLRLYPDSPEAQTVIAAQENGGGGVTTSGGLPL